MVCDTTKEGVMRGIGLIDLLEGSHVRDGGRDLEVLKRAMPAFSISAILKWAEMLGFRNLARVLREYPERAFSLRTNYWLSRYVMSMGVREAGPPMARVVRFSRRLVFEEGARVVVKRVTRDLETYIYELKVGDECRARGTLDLVDVLLLYYGAVPPELALINSRALVEVIKSAAGGLLDRKTSDLFDLRKISIFTRDDGRVEANVTFRDETVGSAFVSSRGLSVFLVSRLKFLIRVLSDVFENVGRFRVNLKGRWEFRKEGERWRIFAEGEGVRLRAVTREHYFYTYSVVDYVMTEERSSRSPIGVSLGILDCELVGEDFRARAYHSPLLHCYILEFEMEGRVRRFYGRNAEVTVGYLLSAVEGVACVRALKDFRGSPDLIPEEDIDRLKALLREVLGERVRFQGVLARIRDPEGRVFFLNLVNGNVLVRRGRERIHTCIYVPNRKGVILRMRKVGVSGKVLKEKLSRRESDILSTALVLAFPELRTKSVRISIEALDEIE